MRVCALFFVAPFLYFLPSFVVADMPQRSCSRFTFCSVFPLPFSLFIAAMCRGAFVRTSICAAFTCRFFPRPRAGAFCCPRTDGESLRAKKTAPLTDQEITLALKIKLIRVSVKYANIVASASAPEIDPPAHSVWKPFVRKPPMSGNCRADCG